MSVRTAEARAEPRASTSPATAEAEAPPDLEQFAKDQIRIFLGQKFKGHALAQLVAALGATPC